ncbi:hypothetical protein [Streptomyces sp. NPDC051132]|uniref:hypothetical protein n=1 Tax=unclassified Streptomyces TaxID=2593676 RepID=UPI003445D52B
MLFAVLLWLLDAIVGIVALLTGLARTDFNPLEPDPHASLTPVFAYGAGLPMNCKRTSQEAVKAL